VALTLKSKLLFTIFGFSTILLLTMSLHPVHAASTLVQQNNAECLGCSNTLSVSFTSNAASGDVIVVGVVVGGASLGVTSLTDSLGSSFTQAIASSNTAPPIVYIYYATLGKSGAEVVTATFTAAAPMQTIYVYEVSGVRATVLALASGSGTGTSISTKSAVSVQSGAFLLAIIGTNGFGGNITAGDGFTLTTNNSGRAGAYAQYATSGISSPSNFQAASSSTVSWTEDAIALMPN
jgi:hypothetical protein